MCSRGGWSAFTRHIYGSTHTSTAVALPVHGNTVLSVLRVDLMTYVQREARSAIHEAEVATCRGSMPESLELVANWSIYHGVDARRGCAMRLRTAVAVRVAQFS